MLRYYIIYLVKETKVKMPSKEEIIAAALPALQNAFFDGLGLSEKETDMEVDDMTEEQVRNILKKITLRK